MSRQPNKRSNEQLQRGINWPTVVGAVVAGVATLVSGYLIGRETEAQLREHHQQQQQQRASAYPSSSSTTTTASVTHSVKETETPDEPATNEDDACVICCDSKINAVNLPCRHSATCMGCARQLRRCCICNAPLQTVIKIFRA